MNQVREADRGFCEPSYVIVPPSSFRLHPFPRFVMEQTFILFKPDCVQRRLVGRIVTPFVDKGLNVGAMKMLAGAPDLPRQHYAEHVNKPFYPGLEKFITA